MKLTPGQREVSRGDVIKWRRRVVLSRNRAGVYVRSLPHFKKGWQSPNQRAWVDAFSLTARMSKTPAPQELDEATRLAKGTLWYYRDVLQTAMYGKLFRFNHEEPVKTPTVMLKQAAPQAIANGTFTDIIATGIVWDNNVLWNAANPTRITFKTAGLYMFGWNLEWSPASSGTRYQRILLNGVTALGVWTNQVSASGYNGDFGAIGLYYFHANDYITLNVHNVVTGQSAQLLGFWALAITPEALIP